MLIKDRLKEFVRYLQLTNQYFEAECGLSNGYIANIRKGIGLMAMKASDMARAGADTAAILAKLESMAERVHVSFVVDTLTYLYRGGRCSGVAALAAGHRAILDASDNGTATLVIEPDGAHVAQADCKIAQSRLHGRTPDPVAALPCLTKDGTAFRLLAATNASSDPEEPLPQGAAGIGLLRTESIILDDIPEDAQFERLQEKLQCSDGAMIAVRTCDTNADDDSPWTAEMRKRLHGHRLFWPQIKALLRAAPYGDLRVLFPMIAGVEDWDTCLQEVDTCREELRREGHEITPPPFGCIVDMPSAALLAGELIEHGAQMLAIDIEDLTRYTLALVQDSDAAVSRVDNPAVQRLVKEVLQQAKAHGVEVYLCGITIESISRIPVYLHLGVRTFSVEPAALLPLKKLLMEETLEPSETDSGSEA